MISDKLIYINGPSLSGKTRLAFELTKMLTEYYTVSNVSFEYLYKNSTRNYEQEFYDIIEDKINQHNVVIAESVMFNKFMKNSALNIVSWPDKEVYTQSMESYKTGHGHDEFKRRVYYETVEELKGDFRSKYSINPLTYKYDGSDSSIERMKYLVMKYVRD